MAVEVLDRLRATHPDATLTMAGQEKGLGDAVRALVHARGLDDAVRFPGFLDAEGKRREFAAHDVFLNTNRVDNMPVSVVEAGAFGLPIVATDVGGVRDLVGGASALLVGDEDVDAMVAAVESLLADPELAGRLSRAGREVAERSGWAALGPAWEAVLADACATHR
jgi:glycosyltransferase involved in cell wall biosynthesis